MSDICDSDVASGSCFCGNIQIQCTGKPIASALCHCVDCRKLTGTLYSYSFIVKSTDFKVIGKPKEIAKTSDSGNHIKNYFCPECGTPLYGLKIPPSGVSDETIVVRAGIFDDMGMLNQRKPELEIYADSRAEWLNPIEGAGQFTGMPPRP